MKYRTIFAVSFGLMLFFGVASTALAQFAPLVPCDGPYRVIGGTPYGCGPCFLLTMANRLLQFGVFLAIVISTLMFTYAGFLYLTSSTSPSNIVRAKSIFWNVLFGLVAALGAWLIINAVTLALGGQSLGGYANQFCAAGPEIDTDVGIAASAPRTGAQLGEVVSSDLAADLAVLDAALENCANPQCRAQVEAQREDLINQEIAELNAMMNECTGTACVNDIANSVAALENLRDTGGTIGPTGTIPAPDVGGSSSGNFDPVDHDLVLRRLEDAGVTVTSTAGIVQQDCPPGSPCTSLNGMREAVVDYTVGLAEGCRASNPACSLTVTGGTENTEHMAGDGATHGNGYKIDIDDNNQYFNTYMENLTADWRREGSARVLDTEDGGQIRVLREGSHWDNAIVPPPEA